jgi:hypothetical protein
MKRRQAIPVAAVRKLVARVDHEERTRRDAVAKRLRSVFAELEVALGPDEARELWQSTPPRRKRGYRKPDVKQERDFSLLLRDVANRYGQGPSQGGMTAEQSAAKMADELGALAQDPGEAMPEAEALRRKLDRLWKHVDPEFARRLRRENRDTFPTNR